MSEGTLTGVEARLRHGAHLTLTSGHRVAGPAPEELDGSFGAVVVGSGAAALTAALAVASAGHDTLVVEKSDRLGGTSAMSGGALWVPANRHALAAGLSDSVEEAVAYIEAAAPSGWSQTEAPLWRAFAEAAPRMLAFVEQNTRLDFALTGEPDPIVGLPGAKGRGRMLSPRPLPVGAAGSLRRWLRPPTQPHLFTYHEMIGNDVYHHPVRTTLALAPKLLWRWLTRRRAQGTALVAGLLGGCLEHGCVVERGSRAVRLLQGADGRVCGVEVERAGRLRRYGARYGVVLATGGFEWDDGMLAHHFPGPTDFRASPRSNSGDGHRMAQEVGAAFAHMDQANINSAIPSRYDGNPHGMALAYHAEPNAILVDRTGERFVNELTFNLGEVLDRRNPATGGPAHLPAWIVTDERFLRRAPVLRWYARPQPGWMLRAPSLGGLAQQMGLPPAALEATVGRYNALCATGVDVDFQRTATGRIETIAPPYVAISFNRSILCTKGGPRTDSHGRVLRPDGNPIEGLYCAGATMANPIGTRAVGKGTTLGPYMTWGYICGTAIAALAARQTG